MNSQKICCRQGHMEKHNKKYNWREMRKYSLTCGLFFPQNGEPLQTKVEYVVSNQLFFLDNRGYFTRLLFLTCQLC